MIVGMIADEELVAPAETGLLPRPGEEFPIEVSIPQSALVVRVLLHEDIQRRCPLSVGVSLGCPHL